MRKRSINLALAAAAAELSRRELESDAERERGHDIHKRGITSETRMSAAAEELLHAFDMARGHCPRVWAGFASTRLERALARLRVELKPRGPR